MEVHGHARNAAAARTKPKKGNENRRPEINATQPKLPSKATSMEKCWGP